MCVIIDFIKDNKKGAKLKQVISNMYVKANLRLSSSTYVRTSQWDFGLSRFRFPRGYESDSDGCLLFIICSVPVG